MWTRRSTAFVKLLRMTPFQTLGTLGSRAGHSPQSPKAKVGHKFYWLQSVACVEYYSGCHDGHDGHDASISVEFFLSNIGRKDSRAQELQADLPETPASLHPARLTEAAPLLHLDSNSWNPLNSTVLDERLMLLMDYYGIWIYIIDRTSMNIVCDLEIWLFSSLLEPPRQMWQRFTMYGNNITSSHPEV